MPFLQRTVRSYGKMNTGNFFFLSFVFFRAALTAHGGSQARGLIRATVAATTATQDPSCVWNLYNSSRQHQILNPLNKARDGTCNLMVPSWFHCATTGTLTLASFYYPRLIHYFDSYVCLEIFLIL